MHITLYCISKYVFRQSSNSITLQLKVYILFKMRVPNFLLVFVKGNCYDLMKLINYNKIKKYKDNFLFKKTLYMLLDSFYIRLLLHL